MQASSARKPEQAIKRADEYIKYGKYGRALEVMYESLQSRKNRTWQPVVEEIVHRFLSVCLRLLNSINSKDILYQYKLTAQYTNAATMESTFLKFVRNAEEQFQQALKKVSSNIDLDNLEKYDTPDCILHKSISNCVWNKPSDMVTIDEDLIVGDNSKSIIDLCTNLCKYSAEYSPNGYLIQSMKFLWDCYRNVLDVCKNNRHTEKIYYDVFLMACKHCVKYNRKIEMKELCKLSRIHAYNAMASTNNPNYAIDFNDKRSGFYQIDLRLKQLEIAINLELYPQSLKTIDLIHRIMCLSERIRKPSMVVIFHKLMVTFFARANMVIYHALALQRFFSIVSSIKTNVTFEELSFLATKTLLSTLSIPINYDVEDDSSTLKSWFTEKSEGDHSEFFTIIEIFKLKTSPTRKSLINELNYNNILSYANTDAVQLYNLMETEPVDITLCQSIHVLLGKISSESDKFLAEISGQKTSLLFVIPSAKNVSYYDAIKLRSFSLLMTKISSIYKSIPLAKVLMYVPFYTTPQLYHILVFKQKNLPSNIVIDDHLECLRFTNKDTFNYVSESTPIDMLYRLETFLDGIFNGCHILPQLEQRLEDFHRQTVSVGTDLLESERKVRAGLYDVAIACGHRREAFRKKREELLIHRREENKKQMDDRMRMLREKEHRKLEHERQIKVMNEERKLSQAQQTKLSDYNTNMVRQAVEELEQKDQIRRAQDELKHRTRTLERKIDHILRAVRLEETSKFSEYCIHFGADFENFFSSMIKKQEELAREKFQYRLVTKKTLLSFNEDITQFYEQCCDGVDAEFRQKRIQERKLAFINEAEEALETEHKPHHVYSAKQDYDLNIEPKKFGAERNTYHSNRYISSFNFAYRPSATNFGTNSFGNGGSGNFRKPQNSVSSSKPTSSNTNPHVRVAKKEYF